MPNEAQDLVRVDYDDLELDDQLASLNGIPFTGIVVSHFQDGRLESETRYVDGLPDGLHEEWYPDGQIAERAIAVRGNGTSESWSWHRNGVQASYRRNADQRPVEIKRWDEQGQLLTG